MIKDRITYPFTAIVGQEQMKTALILNVINPLLGGVLIRGEKGTAKSTVVRALADLMPTIQKVKGCKFGCNPMGQNFVQTVRLRSPMDNLLKFMKVK